MFIAEQLRKKSIAEYLLYMWQIEDTIRAFGCSLPVIRKNYISQFQDFTDQQKSDELDWFGNLIRMMNEEGKREQGHLQINQIIMTDLLDMHNRLLASDRFPFYNAEYYKVLPFIVELRSKNKRAEAKMKEEGHVVGLEEQNEIETCFDALYGVMLLRLQKKEITPETANAMKEITTFVGLLSDYYIKDRDEGLKWSDDDV